MAKTLKRILFSTIIFFATILTLMALNVVTFGWGLGDLFYFYIQILWLIILLVFFIVVMTRNSNFSILTSRIIIFFLLISIFLSIKAFTIDRGNEYPWNGKIFTSNSRNLQLIKK